MSTRERQKLNFPPTQRRATCWVIANRTEAKVLLQKPHESKPSILETLEHPEGKLKERELGTDRPGRGFESGKGNHQRHAYATTHSFVESESEGFARSIAGRLDQLRNQNLIEEITLVAEPHFLGLILGELSHPTRLLVTKTLNKEIRY